MSDEQANKSSELAVFGGPPAVTRDPGDMFTWPIVTTEDEQAVLAVLRAGSMSGWNVTRQFEVEYAAWQGSKFALTFCNGTAALQAAMWAVGVRRGDEVICPSMTYWASGLPALTLGAVPVWADIQRDTLCLDPASAAERISERTKAIVVVHYAGFPADMDEIMAVAAGRGIKVIEDVSHAHGGIYKGRKTGTIGHVGAMSMMSGKSLPIGEGGMMTTDDREIWERAMLWAHYQRHGSLLTIPEIVALSGLPLGSIKGRINQTCSAMGRVQLRHYDVRNAEILRAMNYFWDRLEGTPGVRAHRPRLSSGKAMGGWYFPRGLYAAEELGGLPIERFCEALRAEGFGAHRGSNFPLHTHKLVNEIDIYGDGRPTILANATRDTRAAAGSLPVSEAIANFTFGVPWFKHFRPEVIDEYVAAVKKVAAGADELREE